MIPSTAGSPSTSSTTATAATRVAVVEATRVKLAAGLESLARPYVQRKEGSLVVGAHMRSPLPGHMRTSFHFQQQEG